MAEPRLNKHEAAAVREVLQGLWEKAYSEGELKMEYEPTLDGEKKAKKCYSGLSDFRRYVRERKADNFALYTLLSGVTLKKEGKHVVTLIKKEKRFSTRAEVILDLAKHLPELRPKTALELIQEDFK